MRLDFSFNLLTQPLKYCAENYLRGIVDCCTRCCQKHFIWYVAQFIFTGSASMKWRRKILTKQRESVPHFFQNIRTVLACGRCTIHICFMHFPRKTCFNISFKMAVSLILTFLSKVTQNVLVKRNVRPSFV